MKNKTVEDIYSLAEASVKLDIIYKLLTTDKLKYDSDRINAITAVYEESEE